MPPIPMTGILTALDASQTILRATGFIAGRFHGYLAGKVIAVLIGSLFIYALGVPWLKAMTQMTLKKAWMEQYHPEPLE